MKVLKFGTNTLADASRIRKVAEIVKKSKTSVVVLSAMANTTSLLEEIADYLYKKNLEGANEVINRLENTYIELIRNLYLENKNKIKALDLVKNKIEYIRTFSDGLFSLFEERIVLAQGEILSSGIFTLFIQGQGIKATELSALDFMHIDKRMEPKVSSIEKDLKALLKEDSDSEIFITQGYICKNAYNEIDNFAFGGSDYTASLVGAIVKAEEIQIWTDIDSFYGDNTALVSSTEFVHQISFDEAAELAYFGVKILYPLCIVPAKIANIPVKLLNIFKPLAQGVTISDHTESNIIKAIASKDNIIALNIKSGDMLFAKGYLRKVCEVFERNQTSIDLLTTSEIGISITIDNGYYLDSIIDELKKLGVVTVDKNMTLISIIGDFEEKSELKTLVFDSIKNIPVRMISYGGSHKNISFLIKTENKKELLLTLKEKIY